MKHFDYLYEIAADNYGLITAAKAREVGIVSAELRRWVTNGRLERKAQGVYKLTHYIPTRYDTFAEACAIVGEDAYLYGESVLAMFELALVNPIALTIASPSRRRKKLPSWVHVVPADGSKPTYYEGIPSQTVADAIKACRKTVMNDRLIQAVDDAREKGLVNSVEYKNLQKVFAS